MKTRASYIRSLKEPLAYTEEMDVPPPREGQVLVELAYAGVCHSQLMEARGKRGADKYLPHLLGHEGTGIVREVGRQVSKVKPGDRVVLSWIKGSGCEDSGAQYKLADEIINCGGVTCFEEFAVVSENRVTPLPPDIPLDVAVLFGCALPTGAGIVMNTIQPKHGSTLCVWGLGGIGLSAIIATQLFSCSHVIAIDVEEEKLALARRFGATITLNARTYDIRKSILDLAPGGLDYAVEATGLAENIEGAFDLVKRGGGLLVFASHPEHGRKIQLDPFELICGKNIKGSWGGDCQPDRDIPRFCELFRAGRLPLRDLLSKSYKLNEINEALIDLENRKINRALVEINDRLT